MAEIGDLTSPHIGSARRQGFSKAKLARGPRRDTIPSDYGAVPAYSGKPTSYEEREAHETFLLALYGPQETKPHREYRCQIIDDDNDAA